MTDTNPTHPPVEFVNEVPAGSDDVFVSADQTPTYDEEPSDGIDRH